MASKKSKLVVIGAGPGGYPAAFLASDLGMDVTLIDTGERPGGTCLFHGCIPSKALLHAAEVIAQARNAAALGIHFNTPDLNIDELRNWKNSVVAKLGGGLAQLTQQRNITFMRGRAFFHDSHTITVNKNDGTREDLAFDYAIIATGSYSATLPTVWGGTTTEAIRLTLSIFGAAVFAAWAFTAGLPAAYWRLLCIAGITS